MMFKTHLVFGILLAMLSLEFFNVDNKVLFFLLVVLASSIPDIDASKSKIGSKIKPVSWLIEFTFGHRGIFHGIFMPFVLYFLFLIIGYAELGMALFIGYLGHLVLDCFSIGGVRLFLPFARTRFRGIIPTGSVFDWALMFVFLALVVMLIF